MATQSQKATMPGRIELLVIALYFFVFSSVTRGLHSRCAIKTCCPARTPAFLMPP